MCFEIVIVSGDSLRIKKIRPKLGKKYGWILRCPNFPAPGTGTQHAIFHDTAP
jgi:hypothetical protein